MARFCLETTCALATLLALTACADDAAERGGRDEGAAPGRVTLRLAATDGAVEYRITNRTGAPVHVARRLTPLTPAPDPFVEVSRGGEPLPFRGPVVESASGEGPDNYLELAPGETFAAPVDLASSYEVHEGGSFEVRPTLRPDTFAEGAAVPTSVGPAVRVDLAPSPRTEARLTAGPPPFDGCSPEQKQTLAWAGILAALELQDAVTRFSNDPFGPDTVKWFTATQSPWIAFTVMLVLGEMTLSLQRPEFSLACRTPANDPVCADPVRQTIAYVTNIGPNAPPHVYVCSERFFKLPLEGADVGLGQSMAGLLVHEFAHLGGALDHARSDSYSRNLVTQGQEGLAATNADNYRFYVSFDVLNPDDY